MPARLVYRTRYPTRCSSYPDLTWTYTRRPTYRPQDTVIDPCFLQCLLLFLSSQNLNFDYFAFLLLRNLDTLSESLHLKLLARSPAVDVLDIVGGRLKVAGRIIAPGHEDLVLGTIILGLVQGNWRTLKSISQLCVSYISTGALRTMNCSSIWPRRSRPGWSSRWWLAVVSAMVETIAIQ